jgi:hypothetical protein
MRPAFLPVLALAACSPQPAARPSAPAAPTPDARWSSLFCRNEGWTGADGAASLALPNHRTLWLFGDSWIGPVTDNRHAPPSTLVNNAIAIQCLPGDSKLHDPSAALPPLDFRWNSSNPAKPGAWATPTQPNEWFWPASGAIIAKGPENADRLLLFMSRLGRRDAGDSVWNFALRGTSLLIIANPQEDPARWHITQHTITTLEADTTGAPAHDLMWGAAVMQDPDDPTHLLVYGINSKQPLARTLLIARAPAAAIERAETWTYYTAPGWSSDAHRAKPIAPNMAPELSLHHSGQLNRYVMIYSEPPLGAGILARTANRPEGPWSEPTLLYTCPEPAQDTRNLVYSAKAHPELSADNELLISYCVNSTDFWHMASHADLYLPRFIRVPLDPLRGSARQPNPSTHPATHAQRTDPDG